VTDANTFFDQDLHDGPGVYCILEGDNVLYIGESQDCQRRVSEHPMSNSEKTTAISVKNMEFSRKKVESYLISLYEPRYNTSRDVIKDHSEFESAPRAAKRLIRKIGEPDKSPKHSVSNVSTDLEKELISDRLLEIDERLSKLESDTSKNSEEISDLRHRVHDLEPVAVDLTDREREVLDVLVETSGSLGVDDVQEALDTSYENAGVLLRNVRDKIDLEVETGPNNKKTYKLPDGRESELYGKNVR